MTERANRTQVTLAEIMFKKPGLQKKSLGVHLCWGQSQFCFYVPLTGKSMLPEFSAQITVLPRQAFSVMQQPFPLLQHLCVSGAQWFSVTCAN
jgi:hypothetical protein